MIASSPSYAGCVDDGDAVALLPSRILQEVGWATGLIPEPSEIPRPPLPQAVLNASSGSTSRWCTIHVIDQIRPFTPCRSLCTHQVAAKVESECR